MKTFRAQFSAPVLPPDAWIPVTADDVASAAIAFVGIRLTPEARVARGEIKVAVAKPGVACHPNGAPFVVTEVAMRFSNATTAGAESLHA